MSVIQVDDGNPLIFNGGSWGQINFRGSYNNTQSATRALGAMKVVRFIGTSISVIGGVQPWLGNDPAQVSQYAIDDGKRTTFAPALPKNYIGGVTFYKSPPLPMGEHVLMMMNMVESDLIWLDYFVIQATDGSQAELLSSDGTLSPSSQSVNVQSASSDNSIVSTPSPTSIDFSPAPTYTSTTSSSYFETSSSPDQGTLSTSKSSFHPSSALSSHSTPISQHQNHGTGSMPITTQVNQPTVNATNATRGHSGRSNLTTIVIPSICGSLAILLGALVLILFHKRRRRREKTTSGPDNINPYTSSSNVSLQHSPNPSSRDEKQSQRGQPESDRSRTSHDLITPHGLSNPVGSPTLPPYTV